MQLKVLSSVNKKNRSFVTVKRIDNVVNVTTVAVISVCDKGISFKG